MSNIDLITCFQDTLKFSLSRKIIKATTDAVNSNKVYIEGFSCNTKSIYEMNCPIEVKQTTTFAEAKCNISIGTVAVLNFANPINPGGGVENGAMAQEECLCRSSSLYICISNKNVQEEYYQYHNRCNNYFYSDRLIYTKGITVFKSDDNIPKMLDENDVEHFLEYK